MPNRIIISDGYTYDILGLKVKIYKKDKLLTVANFNTIKDLKQFISFLKLRCYISDDVLLWIDNKWKTL